MLKGNIYSVESIECGWYRIVDESNDDYLYPPQFFDIVEQLPAPPVITPSPMPDDF